MYIVLVPWRVAIATGFSRPAVTSVRWMRAAAKSAAGAGFVDGEVDDVVGAFVVAGRVPVFAADLGPELLHAPSNAVKSVATMTTVERATRVERARSGGLRTTGE
jgi:hypothetical protein